VKIYENIFISSIIITSLLALFFCDCAQPKIKRVKPDIKIKVDTLQATLMYKIDALLGEGALWNYKTQELYWIDIDRQQFHIYDTTRETNRSFEMPSKIGTVVLYKQNEVVVALEDGAYFFNTKRKQLKTLAKIDQNGKNVRFNDGKCDPSGRFWVGTMHNDCADPIGNLYRVDKDGRVNTMLDNITISNGIVWNKAKDIMFYIDTPTGKIVAYAYNDSDGSLSQQKTIVKIDEAIGFPDGMAIDENDNLWVGMWNGNAVLCFDSQTGKILKRVNVPAHNVTACAFGGPNLDQLFITTSSNDMTEEEKKKFPLAGSLFFVKPGVRGVKSNSFGLK